MWIKAGSKHDPQGREGLSHFFEHLLCTKTKRFPDRQMRITAIEREGFLYNALITKELQQYFFLHSPEQTGKAIEFLIDGIWSTQLLSSDIEEEKDVIRNEEQSNYNDPMSYIWRLADRGLWGEKGLGKDLYGNINTISLIGKDDFVEFNKDFFIANNMTLLLINPRISDADILSLSFPTTSFSPSDKVSGQRSYEILMKKPSRGLIFEKRDISTAQIALSFTTQSIKNDREIMILTIIREYLASGWMSRLIQRLRLEKKLTYWVHGESRDYENEGYIRFYLSIAPEVLSDVIKIFEEEIVSLKTKTIPSEILKDHIRKHRADLLRQSIDSDSLLWWYGWYSSILRKNPQTIDEYLQAIDLINGNDIQQIAKKYLTDANFSMAYIGNKRPALSLPTFQ